ncbi:MAG: TolB family protein [Granulosicoccus sp.]
MESVLKTDQHIEAPNWNSNDNSLLVNGAGKLFRVPLNTPALIDIDTGFAQTINNDHGISPDGRSIAISDSTESGKSCIYTLPIQGGTPTRVTDKTPSYWHGWSPDGKTLAYAAKRHDTFQIYTCPVTGGEESCITSGFDHCDGPDYSSDGQWIWFNGELAGSVQLWKIRPDGSQLEQITNDERVNWFPHPSPDGQTVCYLAYEAGITGHPANKKVQLRLLTSDTKEPKVLLDLFGGQGTMNVPSWSKDSQKFAFVQYQTS